MGWTIATERKIFYFLLALFLLLYAFFPGRIYGIEWIAGALTILLLTISGIRVMTQKQISMNESLFSYRLFWSAFVIRVIIMFLLLIISYGTWNMFYTVGARDEMVYYRIASEAAVIWKDSNITSAYNHILSNFRNDIADTGFPAILMVPIYFFGQTPILIKLILCSLGSFVVVRGYILAKLLIEGPAARLAGILLVLYPISWFYSSIMLKESLMLMFITEALILIVKMHRQFKMSHILKALLFITLLFFFRSAISILLLMVLGFSFFTNMKRKNWLINIILAAVVLVIYIYFLKTTGKYDEYYEQYSNIDDFTQERLSYMESINPFVALVGSPVFGALSYVSPFPSVVLVPNAGGLPHTEYYYHVAGNLFWMVLAFFSLYGLYYSFRYKRKEMAVLTAFVVGYQFILLKAMMFTSVRFSYPAKPFLLILAAYGIYHLKSKKWYPVYLMVSILLIIGWNYVRLKGRG